MRFFNTEGPVVSARHYCVPPLDRMDAAFRSVAQDRHQCKVVYEAQRRSIGRIVDEGIAQTAGYMERSGAETGHLVVFDRRSDRDWSERVYRREEVHGEHRVVVWGM